MNKTELKNITKTNAAVVKAPLEFQKKIIEVSKEYVIRYVGRIYSKEMKDNLTENDQFVSIVKNRIENLTVEGIADGSIKEVKDVEKLIQKNAMLQPNEERAIIEAYKEGVEEANNYIYVFFSFKVYDYMKHRYLLDNSKYDTENIYNELQLHLLAIVKQFDENKMKTGGLCKQYVEHKLSDYYRDKLEAQNGNLSYCRATSVELNKIRKIKEKNPDVTPEELVKNYNISKSVAKRYGTTYISLDQETYISEKISNTNDDFEKVDKEVSTEKIYEELYKKIDRKYKIAEYQAKYILQNLHAFIDKREKQCGHRYYLMKKDYKIFAKSINVKEATVYKVIDEFEIAFAYLLTSAA